MSNPSGLDAIEDLIGASAANICPGEADALANLVREKELSLEFVDDANALHIRVVAQKHIELGRRCLSRLWGHVYAYCAFYKTVAQDEANMANFDFSGSATMSSAAELLVWALNDQAAACQGREQLPLPSEAPRPTRTGLTLEHLATEVFLVTTAFLIHHELAHVRIGDEPEKPPVGPDEEFAADKKAANWILTGASTVKHGDISEFDKRMLGIATGLLWLYVLLVHGHSPADSPTHPPAQLRLQALIFPLLKDEPDHPVWTWLALTMSWHLQALGVPAGPPLEPRAAVLQFIKLGGLISRTVS